MSPRKSTKFAGSLRLVPEVDTIGVPVFMALHGNEMYVPELDGDFRIIEFTEFYNEHNYTISWDLPKEFSGKRYAIGPSSPIPFWLGNVSYIIPGDADKEEPVKLFGPSALKNSVLADISRLLDDARSGRISERMREWTAQNISNAFADVFHEQPSRSRYWVTRYRIAIAKARKMAKPPHPIDNRLREVAGNWLLRFGSKTDIAKIGGVLGSSANAIFSKRQITDILFAFLVSKLVQNSHKDLEMFYQEPTLHAVFPQGLLGHYIEHGWPRVPFHYEREDDFNHRMLEALSIGHEEEDYQPAANLSLLIYGRGKVPDQIETLARTYMNRVGKEFEKLRREVNVVLSDRKRSNEWIPFADAYLDYYNQLMDLEGIVIGQHRAKREHFEKRFGVSTQLLKHLKSVQRREW